MSNYPHQLIVNVLVKYLTQSGKLKEKYMIMFIRRYFVNSIIDVRELYPWYFNIVTITLIMNFIYEGC